jgi:hypothetical protein
VSIFLTYDQFKQLTDSALMRLGKMPGAPPAGGDTSKSATLKKGE